MKDKDKEKKAPEPQGPETEAPAEEAEEAKAAPEAPDVDALQKERESIFRDVKADTVTKLLPVYDNLERALKAECSDPQYKKGVELTMTQLKTIFDDLGVKPIEAVGEKFDPTLHNAVMHTESDEHDEGVIVEEFQKGFLLGDKVIRFSLVKVAN